MECDRDCKLGLIVVTIIIVGLLYVIFYAQPSTPRGFECIDSKGNIYYVGNEHQCPKKLTTSTTILIITTTSTISTTSTSTTSSTTTTSTILTFCTNKQDGWYCDKNIKTKCSNGVIAHTKSCDIMKEPHHIFNSGRKPAIEIKNVAGECRYNEEGVDCYKEGI